PTYTLSLHDALPILLCPRYLMASAVTSIGPLKSPRSTAFNKSSGVIAGASSGLGGRAAKMASRSRDDAFRAALMVGASLKPRVRDRKSTRLNSSHVK